MAIIQEVKDGKFVDETSESNKKTNGKKKNVNNEMGQEQFLQLLVAQMQYQDPLEPTSNTEWVSQMATFSMVGSLNDMKSAMSEQSANDLVGKFVLINDGDGFVKGKVDYVSKKNGETVISVNDKLYTLDKLDTVADEEYFQGSVLAKELHDMIALLPNEDNLTAEDDGLLKSAREAYDKMTESQKLFVEDEDIDKLRLLEIKMNSLKATKYTGMVKHLPSISEIEAADEKTLIEYGTKVKEAAEYYDGMTDPQKKLVADETRTLFNTVEAAVANAEKKFAPENPSDSDQDDVSALLQKILDALQSQKQPENQDQSQNQNDSNAGAGQSTSGTAGTDTNM